MNVVGAFSLQAEACAKLGSPFMARLMKLFAERLTGQLALVELLDECLPFLGAAANLLCAGGCNLRLHDSPVNTFGEKHQVSIPDWGNQDRTA